MFTEDLIQRLRGNGLNVRDIRGLLPRNGTWMLRPLSAIKRIAVHYDAENRPHAYDSLERYKSEAQYHINKDWGGGAHGDGIMYHIIVDNVGDVFFCRDFEDVTWHVGNPNYSAVAVKFDGTEGQEPTREQAESAQKVFEVLCYRCPEFPASQGDLWGHREFTQFGGNPTACPGLFIELAIGYRDNRDTHADRYPYDYPPAQPAPIPEPEPEPIPEPVPELPIEEPIPEPQEPSVQPIENNIEVSMLLTKIKSLLGSLRFWIVTLTYIVAILSAIAAGGLTLEVFFKITQIWLGAVVGIGTLDSISEKLGAAKK